jgi:hypothetical protein
MLKMVWPCCTALTRRVANDPPVADPLDQVDRRLPGLVARAQEVNRAASAPGTSGRRCAPPRPGTGRPLVRRKSVAGTGFGAVHAAAIDVDLELFEVEDLLDRHLLPAALGESVRLWDVVDVDADHRLAQPRDTLANTSGSS